MGYYPVFLEVKERHCGVIGGGAVAQRKVAGLLAAGADVTVISPVITEELRSLIGRRAIAHLARIYKKGDLADYAIAFVATDDPEINAAVSSDSRSLNVWVNVADDPAHCDFILPAIVRRGVLTIRGLQLIHSAQVIVYDQLVNPALLEEASPAVIRIFVGKHAGRHCIAQGKINQVLVDHSRLGYAVVRLKGGDQFVFGRGGEEAEALAEAGI